MNQIERIEAALRPCPHCSHKFIPYENELTQEDRNKAIELGYRPPALSRADDETYICSACGTGEAIQDFLTYTEKLR